MTASTGDSTPDLAALRKLADAATPGPWEVGVTYNHQRNAEFIAAARTAVPALLDLVASQAAEIAQLRARTFGEKFDDLMNAVPQEYPHPPVFEEDEDD